MRYQVLFPLILIPLLLSAPVSAADLPSSGTYISISTRAEVNYSSLTGEILLIEGFATWCTPCRQEMKELSLLYDQFSDNMTIMSLSVSPSTDSIEDIERFVSEVEQEKNFIAQWEIGLDHDSIFVSEMDIIGIPTTILFDENGDELKRWEGEVTAEEIGQYIDANVKFPDRDRISDLLNSLINNPLFQISLLGLTILVVYKLLVPPKSPETE